jgi:hypothetical protein
VYLSCSKTPGRCSLRSVVAELLDNRSIKEFFGAGGSGHADKPSKNHLLIMDEVDGMSAGDRGGMAGMHGAIMASSSRDDRGGAGKGCGRLETPS